MYDKVNTDIIQKVKWPHKGLEYQYCAKGAEFQKLTFPQYVAGETKLIALEQDVDQYQGRLRIMNKVAYAYDDTGNWPACRSYYAAIIVAIERGEELWTSNFRRFDHMLPRRGAIVVDKDSRRNCCGGETQAYPGHSLLQRL